MSTTTVIRVERRNGKGFFRQGEDWRNKMTSETLSRFYQITDKHHNMPVPARDKLDPQPEGSNYPVYLDITLQNKDWFCGYKSIDQIQSWLTSDDIRFLMTLKFNVYMIEVTDCQIGRNQILYTKESIKSKKNINSLFR